MKDALKFPDALIKVVRIGTNVDQGLKDAWKAFHRFQAQGGGPIEQTWGVLGGS